MRRLIRRLLGVTRKEVSKCAFSGGDDNKVVILGVTLEVLDDGFFDHKLAAAFDERVHPSWYLQPLVDRLGWPVKARGPFESGSFAVVGRDGERDSFDGRAAVAP